jgi:leucyl aminopeptidase
MPASENPLTLAPGLAQVLAPADSTDPAIPVWLARHRAWLKDAPLSPQQKAWVESQGIKPGGGHRHVLLPSAEGKLAGVVLWLAEERQGEGEKPELAIGHLPGLLPAGLYQLADSWLDAELATLAWGLGAYRFRRYKSSEGGAGARLKLSPTAARGQAQSILEGVWLGRDLINTPAGDLGPEELEGAARALAQRHGARLTSVVGDDLLARNFPMIHAVGRASPRPPRLIDLTWGSAGARRVTLVGKGICFDTGGLDIKPASAMLLMKKDMGGAATTLALGHMIMAAGLAVRLRILIAAAENSIAGNAFRPGDVLQSRSGKSVEIGNTDAEGRLVLADALALGDEERPDLMASFATLTGAARVALGPDLPALFTDDDALAASIADAGLAVADPVWRLPFWRGYEASLDSAVADLGNVSDGPFAGSVTAALFLRRFVRQTARFAHFDMFGWRPAAKPLGPKGGEPQVARAFFELLRRDLSERPT